MTMDLYKKILDDAATISQIGQVTITGLGEPLLDAKLIDRVIYTRKMMPTAFIDMYTNGSYLTPAKFESLKAAGISCISVSLNATSTKQRQDIMGLDDYEKVCEYIDYAIAHRGDVGILVKAVVNNDSFTGKHGESFQARWGRAGSDGFGQIVWEGNWAGDGRMAGPPRTLNASCARALGQIYVTYDGRVTPCCFMPDANVVCLGDLRTQTIREVYNGEWYADFRSDHNDSKGTKHSFCAACTAI